MIEILCGGPAIAAAAFAGVEHQKLDALEAAILDRPDVAPVHMPVKHIFTPGLYSREIFMRGPQPGISGTILTSREHLTEHQYVVLGGSVEVAIPGQAPVVLRAGHVGVTRAGTRRALHVLEDCRWITFHPLSPEEEVCRAEGLPEAELLAMIEERIIGKREREDGRDVLAEYKGQLAAAGLPGVHDGTAAPPILAGSCEGSERASLPERHGEEHTA